MTTRSDRNTGSCRAYRGSGVAGRLPQTRHEYLDWLRENGKKPAHGRYSGTPYVQQRGTRDALQRIEARQGVGRPMGPRPHPTKRGPGRC